LAGANRFVGLADNPPGLFRDEADKAYSTYSLLETGKDLAGRTWPLQIKAFGAYTSPLYHWFSLPFIGGFGVNLWTTRCVAAMAGTLACLGVYLVGREMAGIRAGLFSALLLAVSPWHFLFSRWANQGMLMTLFLPLAAWATWRAVRSTPAANKKVWRWVGLAGLFWALAWIAYAPARLFVPLILFALLGLESFPVAKLPSLGGRGWGRGKLQDRTDRPPHLTSPTGGEEPGPPTLPARLGMAPGAILCVGALTVILILPFLIDVVLRWDETQTRLKFLAGDQPLSAASFLRNYFSHWDPRYLLLDGDANPRHHPFTRTGLGQLTWLEFLSCAFGVMALTKVKGRMGLWLLSWLALAPVPAAITQEGLPHALRTLMIVPAFALLGGIGLAYVLEKLPEGKRWLGRVGIGLGFALQSGLCLFLFVTEYPETSGPFWEAGTLEAFELVEASRRENEVCTVTGLVEHPETFVYFTRLPDPKEVQEGKATEGYEFLPTGKPFDLASSNRKGLFLLRPGEIRKPLDWEEIRPDPPDEKLERAWRLYRSGEKKTSVE
jgi:hypothetical protein